MLIRLIAHLVLNHLNSSYCKICNGILDSRYNRRIVEELTEALTTKLRREGEGRLRREVVVSLGRELEALGMEREERGGEDNLGEKRKLGFEDRRETEGAEQAMN
ncbi:hypothetical protein L195_g058837, partial [Trifolium pratense]